MKRVFVTRPEPGASETAERLAALGFEPIKIPLTHIVPTGIESWPDPDRIDALALTSANAARHAPPALIAAFSGKPAFAVGLRTAETARQAGLDVTDAGAGDAESLAGNIASSSPEKSRVLILCGRVRRDVLETRLHASGFETDVAETYDTLALEPSDDTLETAFGERPVDAVLLYSSNGAAQFRRLAARPAAGAIFSDAVCFCLSARVAAALGSIAPQRVRIARQSTEKSLLAALKSQL